MINKELIANFATPQYPLRASNVPNFLLCPSWVIVDMTTADDKKIWKATDTGTGFGLAAQIYHFEDMDEGLLSKSVFDSLMKRIKDASKNGHTFVREDGTKDITDPFPLADLDQIEQWMDFYAQDSRNWKSGPYGEVIKSSLEASLSIQIKPHPMDKTQLPVYITGHTDQVRQDPHTQALTVWDIKCSKRFRHPSDMLQHYGAQQAIYVQAIFEKYNRATSWGGIIHPPSYEGSMLIPNDGRDPKKKGKRIRVKRAPEECKVFIPAAWTYEAVKSLLDQVALQVALVRNMVLQQKPGEHCNWCHYEGFNNCHNYFSV